MPVPQDEARATHCGKIAADAGAIDWGGDAEAIARAIRAYQPWPGSWCKREGRRLGLLSARATARVEQALPGERLEAGTEETPLRIACGEGALAILKLQPEGKRPLSALDYLRGKPLPAGSLLERG